MTIRRPTTGRRGVSLRAAALASAVLVLVAMPPSAGAEPPGAARAAGPGVPSPPHEDPPVPVSPVPTLPRPVDPAAAHLLSGTPAVVWPESASGQTAVSAWSVGNAATTQVGQTPVWIGPVEPASDAASAASTATEPGGLGAVRVDVRTAPGAAGVPERLIVVLRPAGTGAVGPRAVGEVAVQVDYSAFRDAYGGDWASRLRLAAVPDCAAQDVPAPDCPPAVPVPTRNDLAAGRVSARVPVAPAGSAYELAAAPAGSTGDYKATPPAPTATWQVAPNSGNFSWSYPLRVPPTPGGLQPSPTLSYSSGATDGRVAAANNQSSWAGEGWDLWPGSVTRSFAACTHDAASDRQKTGDQCWAGDQFVTMTHGGKSTELVRAANGTAWRPRDDDGSRVELLTGADNGDRFREYWKVTTTDGTQYFFGSRPEAQSTWTVPVVGNHPGEPCHTGDFATSACDRAWRWNLDRVVDVRGHTVSYQYAKEVNRYGRDMARVGADYVRGGSLVRAEYGGREGDSGPAPARVVFETADRCVPRADCARRVPESYPDVPWDQECTGGTCPGKYSPTFWTARRLARVVTQTWTGSAYQDVDAWTLDHGFPEPGDGTRPGLWLRSITHTGLVDGSAAMPPVEFDGVPYPNRVDSGPDGLPALNKFRLYAIHNETGGVLQIGYTRPECLPGSPPTPETNSARCFPVYWAHDGGRPRTDWFHKYAVEQVVQVDRTGRSPAEVTTYEYVGGGAWRYHDNPLVPAERRTWSQWRGYARVIERKGDPTDASVVRTEKETSWFRGMHGDRLAPAGGAKSVTVPDSEGRALEDTNGLQGFPHGEIVRAGPKGPVVTDTVKDPWRRQTAANGDQVAAIVREGRTLTKTALGGTAWRRTETLKRYDEQSGLLVETADLGDTAVGGDDRCTRTSYAPNTATWLLSAVSRSEVVAVGCTAVPTYPDHVVSDERTFYDGRAWGEPPTEGNATRTEKVSAYADGRPVYVPVTRARHDVHGRVVESVDALDRRTLTAYEPPTGPPRTSATTNPLGHTTTTTLLRPRNEPQAVVDANGRRTEFVRDPLGRLTEVWAPGSAPNSRQLHERYAYAMRKDTASYVATSTAKADGGLVTEFVLYDGVLRPRQTQKPAWGGGRVVTDTFHDSRGLVVRTNNAYNTTGAPGGDLVAADPVAVPAYVATQFDGAARPVASTTHTRDRVWRTTTAYFGDRTDVVPPTGGTTTSTYTDARGRTTELRQYHGPEARGPYDATRYTYAAAGQLETLADPAGNTLRYKYNLLGHRIEAHDPDKGATLMRYDDAGQLRSRTDARGTVVVHAYDPLGRRTEIRAGSETGPVLAQWTYDTVADPLTGTPVKGQMASASRFVGDAAYRTEVTGYDAAYRVTGSVLTLPAGSGPLPGRYETATAYHPDGSIAAQRYPAVADLPAETVLYGYDSLGLLRTVTSSSGSYVTDTHYTALSEPDRVTHGSDGASVWQSTYYEPGTRRVARTLVEREAGTTTVDETTYGYDPAGNVVQIRAAAPDGTDLQCFAYDHLRRTKEAWASGSSCATPPAESTGGPAPYWTGFTYDASGNRQFETRHGLDGGSDTVRTYQYPPPGAAQPHTVRSITTGPPEGAAAREAVRETYDYSPTGATTTRPGPNGGTQQVSWDAEDRPSAVTDASGTIRYVYAADGARLRTDGPAGATLHLPNGEIHADAATGALRGVRYYTDAKSRTVAVREGAAVSYQVNDQPGTGTVAVDARTLADTRRRLDAFGQPRGKGSVDLPGSRGFVGGTQDPATGLTRLGARDYDPAVGRFTSVDPLLDPQDPQSVHGFAYAHDNPATMHDPTGTICALIDSPGGARCVNTGLTRPPLKVTDLPPQKDDGRKGRPHGSVGIPCAQGIKMGTCSVRPADVCFLAPGSPQCRELRAAAEARRSEEARRKEAERKNAPITVMFCTSYTATLGIASVGVEDCDTHDSTGADGKSVSIKAAAAVGVGFGVGKQVKVSQGGVEKFSTSLGAAVDVSAGMYGVGVDAGGTIPIIGGGATVGAGVSYGFGTPSMGAGLELGISWR